MVFSRRFFLVTAAVCLLASSVSNRLSAAPGDLDPSFGNGGIVLTDFGSFEDGVALALQPDGRIVAGAVVASQNGPGLARFLPDGTLDASFGQGGKTAPDLFGTNSSFQDIALQPDGKIVAAGWLSPSGPVGTDFDFWLARYNSDGSLDAGFGNGGKVITDLSSHSEDILSAIAVQPDGRIVAVGMVRRPGGTGDFVVVRYRPDGGLDPEFGTDGKAVTDMMAGHDDLAFGVALQPDGKIVAVGFTAGAEYGLARYDIRGRLDPSFGGDGTVTPESFLFSAVPLSIVLQPDGKILTAGVVFQGSDSDFALRRFLADGRLDPGFGAGGRVFTDFGRYDQAWSLTLQPDGGIVAAGFTRSPVSSGDSDFALAFYRSDGSLDPRFGDGGKVVDDFGFEDYIAEVLSQPDGRILATGRIFAGGTTLDLPLVRYLGTGQACSTPPGIAGATASPAVLWPPNHRMVDVRIPYTAADGCAPAAVPRCALSVSSNEPAAGTGDGDTAPDWQVVDEHRVRLRAERAGHGNGRIYTVTITCTNNTGASSIRRVTVQVPKSRGKG